MRVINFVFNNNNNNKKNGWFSCAFFLSKWSVWCDGLVYCLCICVIVIQNSIYIQSEGQFVSYFVINRHALCQSGDTYIYMESMHTETHTQTHDQE